MTREEALSILKSILADLQRGAKDTDNVSCCLEFGFITYGKAKDCIKVLEQEPTTKNDAVSRQAVLNTLDNMDSALDEDGTVETYKELLKECYKVLPSVTPQEPRCKDCKWWKDSDGAYRRGVRAESQCPINRREVFEGNGYCYMFEPRESEDNND